MSVNLGNEQPAKGYSGEPRVAWISFAPNGTSNPLTSSNTGPSGIRAFTTTYSPTGVQTIVFPENFAPPSNTTFLVSAQCASIGAYFEVVQIGAYNASTRTLVVQTKQGSSGNAVAAAAGARVHIGIFFNDSTGA